MSTEIKRSWSYGRKTAFCFAIALVAGALVISIWRGPAILLDLTTAGAKVFCL